MDHVRKVALAALICLASVAQAQKLYDKTYVPPNLPVLYSQNYATLQLLSDAIPAGGGTMVISPGTYTVATVITLKSNTTVQCLPGATLTMTDAGAVVANHWIFANVNYTAVALTDSNIRILGCAFNGNSATPSTGADAIRFVFASDVEVSGNTFTGFGDATAFLGTARSLVANNKATAKISNTCWDHWWAASKFRVIDNYCETHKHGTQITGTDTPQTSAGIAGPGTIRGNTYVLYSASTIGAAVYLNSGASSDTGAGAANITVADERITTSGLGSSVGDCIKVSGSGSTNDWIVNVKCDNSFIYVGPADSLATSYPTNIHVRDASVNLTNTYADGAIQIKTGTSGVESSRVTGAGYAYCFNLIGATNQYAQNNSCVAGTDGSLPRVHTDGTSLATALIIDTDETGSAAAMTESALIYNSVSYRSPKFILGTASNGFVQYDGGNKVSLDETDASTGVVTIRTDSGAGLADRFTVRNNGDIQIGAADAAAPTARTIVTQGSRGGTDTNIAGANLTIQSGLGTGNAAGSTLTLQTPTVGSTGTAAETAVNGLLLGATAISVGNATSNPTVTFLGSGAISGTPVTSLFASPPAIGGSARAAGAFTTLGANALITGTLGATLTGADTNINASSNFNTNIGTGSTTGTTTLGQNSATPGSVVLKGPVSFQAATSYSAANWGTTSPVWNGVAMTLNDTAASGTVTNDYAYSIQAPNFTSTGGASTTITNAGTLFIAAPTCTTVNCTNLYALNSTGNWKTTGSATVAAFTAAGGTNINASQNSSTNIGTGSTNALVTIGGGSNGVIINAGLATGYVKNTAFISIGTKFTLGSGTGSCGTTSTTLGGASAGSFVCTGTAGAGTIVVTINGATGLAAPNGWACSGSDITSGVAWSQSATSTTTCTLKGTTAANTDVVVFQAQGY